MPSVALTATSFAVLPAGGGGLLAADALFFCGRFFAAVFFVGAFCSCVFCRRFFANLQVWGGAVCCCCCFFVGAVLQWCFLSALLLMMVMLLLTVIYTPRGLKPSAGNSCVLVYMYLTCMACIAVHTDCSPRLCPQSMSTRPAAAAAATVPAQDRAPPPWQWTVTKWMHRDEFLLWWHHLESSVDPLVARQQVVARGPARDGPWGIEAEVVAMASSRGRSEVIDEW